MIRAYLEAIASRPRIGPRPVLVGLMLWAIAPRPAAAISLDECLELARRNAPSLQAASAQVSRAEEAVREAGAARRPTLHLDASLTQNNEGPKAVFDVPGQGRQVITLGSATALDVKTKARYTLYSGGRDPALVRAAQAEERAQSSSRDQEGADLVLRITRAYYRELSAFRLLAAADEALAAADNHLTIARARVKAGVAPKLDALRAEVDASERGIAEVQAREARLMARLELETAIGTHLDPAEALDEPPSPGGAVPDSIQAMTAAVAARPEIAAFDRELEQVRAQLEAAQAGHRPELSLTGTAQYKAPNRDDDYANFTDPGLKTYSLSAGVEMSLPLFDGGLVDARVAGLVAERTAVEARRRDELLAIEREVRQALSDLRVAVAEWGSNESRISSAREALRLAEASYKEGTGTATDVRDAETALADAQAEEARSLADYWSARAELDHAIGAGVDHAGAGLGGKED